MVQRGRHGAYREQDKSIKKQRKKKVNWRRVIEWVCGGEVERQVNRKGDRNRESEGNEEERV